MTVEVRTYVADDERDWLRLRVLAFMDTPYYDNVLQVKERYRNPAIELVCVEAGQLVGLIDVELDSDRRPVCSLKEGEASPPCCLLKLKKQHMDTALIT